jgi:hypothetical protein
MEFEEYKKKIFEYCRNIKVGDKIKFKLEKQRYVVKAKDDRYLICTKPFNPKNTVLYTIVDLERFVRGCNNQVFNIYDYTNQDDIDECLIDLQVQNSCLEVSYRNCIPLDISV